MSHTITITRLPDEQNDDAEYTVGGTCTPHCIVWWECKRAACQKMNPSYGDERTRHGIHHQHISGIGWCVESNECGQNYAYDLGLDAERAERTGTYPLSIEWDGDGWDAFIDFDKHQPLVPASPVSEGAAESCKRCGGQRTVNLGIRSDPEYHPCPECDGTGRG